ncbi:uncharacterized protein LOC117501458 [Thalassophryne amazonica]|uniref:uncharacterized protein LOC117501458 n=1 Tax=Thalassophryne amazonica TaxID=390379 RepID=UPI0014712EB9|nr:uncharacterized protein LOC117501458 [Thalassophryne amazonica]
MAHDSVILGPTICLLHLLLLAQLFVCSVCRPTYNSSLCPTFGSLKHQVAMIKRDCKGLHGLNKDLSAFEGMEHRLHGLPSIEYTASHIGSLTINRSLSEMYVGYQAFEVHVDWLSTVRHNASLSIQSAQMIKGHLLKLVPLLNASLHQVSEQVTPTMTSPSFPAISTPFDALQFSVELSEELKMFCLWSERVLHQLQSRSRCPK